MRELPGFEGPMAGEPPVEEVLRALQGSCTIAVATNGDLGVEALARAGLDRYASVVLTARGLGVAKPERAFFHAALARVGSSPPEAVMVGDSYGSDVVGAKGAGLKAVWFNPSRARCPLVHPVHDAEIRTLGELPDLLARPFLPDLGESLRILREHGVPENIVRHSLAVAAVAHHLALRLRERGVDVDALLVHRGALLHDLDKVSSEKPADHGVKAGRILRELGWPELAAIAERHVLGAHPETWEEKLVHYADKIVEEGEVVGLEARVTALSCRYNSQGDQIARALPALLALQEEVAAAAGVAAEELLGELRELDADLPPFVAPEEPPYDRGEEGT